MGEGAECNRLVVGEYVVAVGRIDGGGFPELVSWGSSGVQGKSLRAETVVVQSSEC